MAEASELRTARLRLRRARPEDLEDLHAILSHPEATRYWSTPPHEDREQTRAWLTAMIESPPELSDDFVVELDSRVVGKAGFYRLPEIGYILHPDVWGRGLATEALQAVIGRVFASGRADRVTADVDPRNAASLRLLERLGFVETGRAERVWLIGGAWHDSVYLAVEAPAAAP